MFADQEFFTMCITENILFQNIYELHRKRMRLLPSDSESSEEENTDTSIEYTNHVPDSPQQVTNQVPLMQFYHPESPVPETPVQELLDLEPNNAVNSEPGKTDVSLCQVRRCNTLLLKF